jgi:capsid protein
MDQELIIARFMRPVFERWLAVQLLAQNIKLPATRFDKFNKPQFIARRWSWVDPKKDIEASILALDNGLSSRSDVLAEEGKDFYAMLQSLKREKQLAEAAGIELVSVSKKPVAGDTNDQTQDANA